jgi:signal transduction histidine kinase
MKRWVNYVSDGAAGWLEPARARTRSFRLHFCIIAALMLFGAFTYYVDQTPLVRVPPFNIDLLTGVHDFQRTLFLFPIMYGAIIFRIRGCLVTSIVFLCVVVPRALLFSPYPEPLLRASLFVIVAALVSLLVAVELNQIDREKDRSKLEKFLADTLDSQEMERQHLARELHDQSLQDLVDISHNIDAMSEMAGSATMKDDLKRLRGRVDAVLTGIRQVVFGLRPPLLEEVGIVPSLTWLAQKTGEEQGIKVEVKVKGEPRRIPDVIRLHLFRIAQEAIANAKNHSSATAIGVQLVFTPDTVQVTVRDNGRGFSVPHWEILTAEGKFGLIGMAERAHLTGGTFRIESSAENGTTVSAELPTGVAGSVTQGPQ